MGRKTKSDKLIYDTIVVGAGASGLFYAAGDQRPGDAAAYGAADDKPQADVRTGASAGSPHKLILEKTDHPGQKLLMSGNGMCNITHGGSIKDFISHYGESGKLIRSCLYRHNNIELINMMQKKIGVLMREREDGKVFPASLKAKEVLDALLLHAKDNGYEIRCGAEVTAIRTASSQDEAMRSTSSQDDQCRLVRISLTDGTELTAHKLVIATGGCSYPATGSDGSFYGILERDLGLEVSKPHPALTPIYIQDFAYGDLSGVSFDNVRITCGKHTTTGPMLITHRGLSGPAILHMSQYVDPGDKLMIDFVPDLRFDELKKKLRESAPGNRYGIGNYLVKEFGIPKAFAVTLIESPERLMRTINARELDMVAKELSCSEYSVSGTGGWNDAMVTKGGVALDQIDLKTMRLKNDTHAASDIRIIGEALDINGDTGGYNLQFAYSSAMAAHE